MDGLSGRGKAIDPLDQSERLIGSIPPLRDEALFVDLLPALTHTRTRPISSPLSAIYRPESQGAANPRSRCGGPPGGPEVAF